jgi:hypothetical protein
MPFAAPCGDFVTANFPNLVSFSARCTSSQGSTPVAPPPPASAGTTYYAEATLQMNNAKIGTGPFRHQPSAIVSRLTQLDHQVRSKTGSRIICGRT